MNIDLIESDSNQDNNMTVVIVDKETNFVLLNLK